MIDFVFLRPYWLMGAIICLAALFFVSQTVKSKSRWWELMDHHIAHFLIEARGSHKWLTPMNLILVLIAAICISLAGPSIGKQLPDELKGRASVVVLLANGDSMYAGDITPNRNRLAKQKIKDLRKSLPESQFGLIAYAQSAHQVSPLTSDPKFMDFYLDPVEPKLMPDRQLLNTGLQDALRLSKKMINGADYPVNLVIMADQLTEQDSQEIITYQKNAQIGVEVLAIGTESGGSLRFVDSKDVGEPDTRMALAPFEMIKAQGIPMLGITQSNDDIQWVAEKIQQSVATTNDDNPDFKAKDSGYWLALIFLPACLMLFRKRTWLMSLAPLIFVVATSSFSPTAEASSWEELWWSPDQLGQKALDRGSYQEAAHLFDDPYLKGWAFYQLADYQSAETYFKQVESAESFFYLANTLSKQEKYKEALEYYGKAIALDGRFEEAEKNLETTKLLLANANKVSGNERQVEDDGQIMLQVGVQGKSEKKSNAYIDPLIYSEEELNVWLDKVKSSPEKLLKAKFELQSQDKMIDEL